MWSVCINRHSSQAPFTFGDLCRLQDEVLARGEPSLLFAEVAPTVTLGNRQDPAAFESLRAAGIEVVAGHRGGLETWHGPGQWVGFVVCPIERLSGEARGVRRAVYSILDSVKFAVQKWVPDVRMEEGDRLGLWTEVGKLVSIGIRVREGWVTSGFALNVIPSPHSFSGIHPCGLNGAQVDFLFKNRVNQGVWDEEFAALPARLARYFEMAEKNDRS